VVEVEHSTEALAPMHWLRWRDDGGRAAGVEAPHDAEPRPNGTDARGISKAGLLGGDAQHATG